MTGYTNRFVKILLFTVIASALVIQCTAPISRQWQLTNLIKDSVSNEGVENPGPDCPETLTYFCAVVEFERSRYGESLQLLKRSATQRPGLQNFYSGLALDKSGHNEQSIQAFKKANAGPYFYSLGFSAFLNNQHVSAIEYFEKAISIDADQHLAHYHLAQSLLNEGRVSEALEPAKSAADIFPSTYTLIVLGNVNRLLLRFEDAEKHYIEIASLEDPNAQFLSLRYQGLNALDSGDMNRAVHVLNQSLALAPDVEVAELSYQLALAYFHSDQQALATKAIENALGRNANNPRYQSLAVEIRCSHTITSGQDNSANADETSSGETTLVQSQDCNQ